MVLYTENKGKIPPLAGSVTPRWGYIYKEAPLFPRLAPGVIDVTSLRDIFKTQDSSHEYP